MAFQLRLMRVHCSPSYMLRLILIRFVFVSTGEVCMKRVVDGEWISVGDCQSQPTLKTVMGDIKRLAEKEMGTDCSLDVMFALDGSGSIGDNNFLLMKQWVKTMAAKIEELQTDAQIGVMQYSHYYPRIPVNHKEQDYLVTEVELDYYNHSDFASAVDSITLMGFTTFTAAALRKVKYDFLNSKNFDKSRNIQILILITDGKSDDFNELPQSAKDLRAIGVIPHVFGVGQYDLNELRIIATGDVHNPERVKVFEDFTSLISATVDLEQYLHTC